MLSRLLIVLGCAAALALVGLQPAAKPPAAAAADRDCSDFATQAAAQRYFISKGGPARDPDSLDSDGDGTACETNLCPCQYGPSTGGGSGQRIRARVLHAVDGDTVEVRAFAAQRRRYTVRLIGIDTPEKFGGTECGARRASKALLGRAPRGLRVTLITDPSQDRFDRYDRLLAYIVRRRDGVDLGRTQLSGGWARVYVFDNNPFRRLGSYRRAQRAARSGDRGVWRICDGRFHHGV